MLCRLKISCFAFQTLHFLCGSYLQLWSLRAMSSANDDSVPLPPMGTASMQPTSHFFSLGASEGETLSSKSKAEKNKGVWLRAKSWNRFTRLSMMMV
ncbi:hypothetical protein QQP08_027738 [Theobroma cacao]|nr:hypothetical protein QQP08_027738 [Theobroma cacao]